MVAAKETATRVSPLLGLGSAIALLFTASAAPPVAQIPDVVYLREAVGYLAGPECAGRRPGTPGAELAAQYIEGQLEILGVEPFPGLDGYRQEFPVTRGIHALGEPYAALDDAPWEYGADYQLAAFSGSGSFDNVALVFAGYGINAPELGWDDYANIDVAGKAVLIVRGEPQLTSPDSKFSGDQPTVHADLRRKAAAAKAKGAAALLVLENPLTVADPDVDALPEQRPAWGGSSSDLPVLHVRRGVVAGVFEQAQGHPLTDILNAMNSHAMPASGELPATFSLGLAVEKEQLPAWNIVGVIPGSGELASEYVVIGAHYDHLGEGGPESLAPSEFGRVHWGADDNASGVAAVLAIARDFSMTNRSSGRSVLVVLFSAEEIGLVGSNWLVEHSPVPLESIHSVLNFDMVGRLRDNKLTLGGTATAAEFGSLLGGVDSGLTVLNEETGMGGSDHMSYINRGISALFFHTGSHADYHTPDDTADLINYDGLAEVADYGSGVLQALLASPGRLTFVKPELPNAPTRNRAGLSVTLGTVPSYVEGEIPGFLLGDVVAGGPAAQAGLLGGDVITRIGEVAVANIYDFMHALQGKQPGDVVEVAVLRGGEELLFSVTLAARGVQQ